MSAKQNTFNTSPVLFMTVDGEPMSFFLRPGPVKRKLQPLITAGGGMLCNVQQPGAILLMEPGERGSVTESKAHWSLEKWFVSTQYIYDCIEKDEQLNLEDYRLKPEVVQRQSARLNNDKLSGGRIAFTNEDDAAILSYVSKHTTQIGGNRLWKEMEKKRVTSHSWQSMKSRYRDRLAEKQSEVVVVVATTEEDADSAEGENKVEAVQNTEGEKLISVEDGASPQTHSKEDLTQIDAQFIPAESMQSEIAEAPTSICPQGEVEPVNPQTDKESAERTTVETVEAETYAPPQPDGSCLDLLTDLHPIPAENTELETDEPQTITKTDSVPEDSPTHQPTSLSKTPQKPDQPLRQLTRRQLQLKESSPEPYGKKLRSSSSPAKQLSPSPKPSNKTQPAVESDLQKDKTADKSPSKKARGKSVAAVAECQQEERGPSPISETTQAVPKREEKKNPKRKLGILEMATREFEDESESDEGPDLQSSTETATVKPVATEPRLPSPDGAASESSPEPEPGPSLQQNMQESPASSSHCLPTAGSAEPAATKTVDATHLFIFKGESQEEDPQPIFGDNPAAQADPQPTISKDAAFSLTQDELEQDKKRIRELMTESNKDLVTVTKALLKTSGNFSDALDLLLNRSSISGRLWQCSDDDLLLSGDPGVRQQLLEKYGEQLVAKRIAFLELEG